jgi:hypothetical protein
VRAFPREEWNLTNSAAELSLSADQLAKVERVFEKSMSRSKDTAAILREHLRQLIARCAGFKSSVLVVSYPEDVRDIDDVVENVANEMRVRWLNLRPEFRASLKSQKRRDLVSTDNHHLTDRGYAIVARLIADEVLGVTGEKRIVKGFGEPR